VRVDFDWGTTGLPGGSTSPGFSSIGTNAFSALWTGRIVPKYSETYTFKTITTGGITLSIEPASGHAWTTVVNDWTAHSTTTDSGTFSLTAGQIYNIKLQYYNNQANAVARLHWSSPSTPEEAIEAATNIGINAGSAVDYDTSVMFADAMKMARVSSWTGNNGATLDSNGWPTGDGSFYLFAGQNTDTSGLWTVTFTGQATFGTNLVSYTNFTQSYTAATNITTITFKVTPPVSGLSFQYPKAGDRHDSYRHHQSALYAPAGPGEHECLPSGEYSLHSRIRDIPLKFHSDPIHGLLCHEHERQLGYPMDRPDSAGILFPGGHQWRLPGAGRRHRVRRRVVQRDRARFLAQHSDPGQ
jgi:hypothetical protein